MGIVDKIRLWFPKVDKCRKEADQLQHDVEVLKTKTLTFNGDLDWLIDVCRQHKDEVCDDTNDAS